MALLQLRRTRVAAVLLVAVFALLTQVAWASSASGKAELPPLETLSLEELDAQLQVRLPSHPSPSLLPQLTAPLWNRPAPSYPPSPPKKPPPMPPSLP